MYAPSRRSLLRALCPAVLAALSIAAAGCGDDDTQEQTAAGTPSAAAEPAAAQTKPQKTVRFVMPVPAGPDLAAYYVADDQFGAENGVKLEFDTQLIATQGAKKIMQDQADAFLGITTVLAVVNDAGLPLKYFRDDFVRNLTGFAVPADSDITSIADLKGKKIGIVDPGWPVVWDPIMRAAGLKPDDYEYKVVGVGNYQAMAAGKVDAVASWAMNWQPPDASIQKLRYLPGDALPEVAATPSNGVMVKADVLAEKPEWLVGLGRSISQAQEFMKANPECAAKIAEKYVESEQPFEVTLAQVREQIEYHRNEATDANGLGFSDPAAFDRMLADMKAGGVIKKDLAATDIVDNSLIPEINEFDAEQVAAKAKACAI
jgi:NitT/TauT family transport system substrate-binding protein